MPFEIIVPYWGSPALLYRTVDSVLAQHDQDWRLTVLDDCYPDESVAAHFGDLADARVRYVRNPTNVGITENYRRAIALATESHVTLLGSDDLLLPDYIAVVKRTIAAAPGADVIQPGVTVIDEEGRSVMPLVDLIKQRLLAPRRRHSIGILQGERMATSLIRGNWLYWPSLTFRTETLKRTAFREGLPTIQDLALLMDIAFAGGSLAYNPEVAFAYRRHGLSASQRTLLDGTRFRDERRYYRLAADLARARGWTRTQRAARWRGMSRLHAVTELPGVISPWSSAGVHSALAHIFDF